MSATILVVDDDCAVRTLMRLVLECAGYGVLIAADGKEGFMFSGSTRTALRYC